VTVDLVPAAVLTAGSPGDTVDRWAGGKGRGLHRLVAAGLPVPAFAVLGTPVLAGYLAATGVGAHLDDLLADLCDDNANATATAIGQLFAATDLDPASAVALDAAMAHLGDGAIAVRSSGVDEDGRRASFAGQHATYLNVTGRDDAARRVRDCWASAYRPSALAYRRLHDLPIRPDGLAVVLQRIVPAEVSGVLFTANPLTGRLDEALVSAVYGLGESLVSGAVDADTVTLDRRTGERTSAVVGDKHERLEPAAAGSGCSRIPVAPDLRRATTLTDERLTELRAVADRVEEVFDGPQDVEWAFAGGRLWLLQSRPVTGLRDVGGRLRVWDNANIVESFGAVTAPLTFSFARHVYHRLYREYLALLGVPAAELELLDPALANMLGWFDGRVYYNVLHWDQMIGLLPFARLNRRILEAAMGVRQTPVEQAAVAPSLRLGSPVRQRLVRARIAARYTWYAVTVARATRAFLRRFDEVYADLDTVDLDGMSGDDVYLRFMAVERALLSHWGPVAVLDNVLCLAYGALSALTGRWLPDAPEWFQWEVVRVDGDLASAEPVRRLTGLAAVVHTADALREALRRLPAERFDGWLREAPGEAAGRLRDGIADYLRAFGHRSANELKLEEPDLIDDPTPLWSMLAEAVEAVEAVKADEVDEADGAADRPRPRPRARAAGRGGGADADAYLDARLTGWRRRVFERARGKVRACLRDRERVRMARTRAFGLARRLLRAMGADLARCGALDGPRNVFQLRLEEVRGAYEGSIDHRELRPLARLRDGRQRAQRQLSPPPSRFVTTGSPYWGATRVDPAPELPGPASGTANGTAGGSMDPTAGGSANGAAGGSAAGGGRRLTGVGCSPGRAVGEARVVDAPHQARGGVVVAYRTDPGWVGVLPSAAALLVERGSPLTHIAIVARELGVPTIVQIQGLTNRVRTGMVLRVDGDAGTVDIDEEARSE
jgi:pyruvate,water dikinase